MFQVFVATSTTATMLAHALLGCCWHHDHCVRAENSDHCSSRQLGESHCGHEHSAHEATSEESHQRDQPRRHSCDDAPCVYMQTEPLVACIDSSYAAPDWAACIDEFPGNAGTPSIGRSRRFRRSLEDRGLNVALPVRALSVVRLI